MRLSSVARYNDNFTPPFEFAGVDASTIGLWHMNEGTGDIISDAGIYSNDGTFSDADLRVTQP